MMGKVFSVLKRPFINFAVEERASRVLDKAAKTKPTKAPLYPTEEKVLHKIQREHPELLEKIKTKNEKLDGYLKQVKVKTELLPSERNPSLPSGSSTSKVLPQERILVTDTEFGLPEVPLDKVPAGKLTFRQAMEIFKQIPHETSSRGAQDIAQAKRLAVEQYKLEDKNASLILQYFRPFLLGKDVEDVLVTGSHIEELKDPEISGRQMMQDSATRSELQKQMRHDFAIKQSEQFKKLEQERKAKENMDNERFIDERKDKPQ